jgi:hypothetical protein
MRCDLAWRPFLVFQEHEHLPAAVVGKGLPRRTHAALIIKQLFKCLSLLGFVN